MKDEGQQQTNQGTQDEEDEEIILKKAAPKKPRLHVSDNMRASDEARKLEVLSSETKSTEDGRAVLIELWQDRLYQGRTFVFKCDPESDTGNRALISQIEGLDEYASVPDLYKPPSIVSETDEDGDDLWIINLVAGERA